MRASPRRPDAAGAGAGTGEAVVSRWSYFLTRLALSVPVVVLGTTLVFAIVYLGPLDPAAAIVGATGDPRAYERIREQLGLNEPLWRQYLGFMWDMFTLDLGRSWVVSRGTGVYDLILVFAPRTLWLGLWSVLIAVLVGVPLGFYAGLHPNTWIDHLVSFGGIVWRAMPNFWLAVILVAVLSQSEDVLFGFDWRTWLVDTPNVVTPPPLNDLGDPANLARAIKAIAPAALVLGSASMGNEMRIARTAVLETANSEYVETAKAKGVAPRTLVWKHVFRNALVPLVPVITGEALLLLGGSVLVETVFAINGLGYLFFRAVTQADLPLAASLLFFFVLLVVGINILQDFLYTVIDPRVGYEGEGRDAG